MFTTQRLSAQKLLADMGDAGAMITATRYHDISCGHRVHGHESKCAHLHGHNYRITFHCIAERLDGVGRVVDFSVIKATLCEWLEEHWDHKFLIGTEDPMVAWILSPMFNTQPDIIQYIIRDSLVIVPFNPTAENMAEHLLRKIGPALLGGLGITLSKVEVSETRKCSAVAALA